MTPFLVTPQLIFCPKTQCHSCYKLLYFIVTITTKLSPGLEIAAWLHPQHVERQQAPPPNNLASAVLIHGSRVALWAEISIIQAERKSAVIDGCERNREPVCSAAAGSLGGGGGSGGDSVCGPPCETADVWHGGEELMSQPLIKARDRVIGLSDERVKSRGNFRGVEGAAPLTDVCMCVCATEEVKRESEGERARERECQLKIIRANFITWLIRRDHHGSAPHPPPSSSALQVSPLGLEEGEKDSKGGRLERN